MPHPTPPPMVPPIPRALITALALAVAAGALVGSPAHAGGGDHLLITELATGGASANDEFVELHNPTTQALPLAGHELVYVSASGATVTQRAAWGADATALAPGAYLLLANEAGIHAAAADVRYAGGIAAGGGTVVLRLAGSGIVVDAVAWGTAAGAWLEGTPAPAPSAGASIERVASSLNGRAVDTDDTAADFVERAPPTPHGGGAVTPTPVPSLAPLPTPSPSPTPAASASPAISIADARGAPNGTVVTVDGTALTGSAFHDGGGFVADGTGGIAVLVEGGGFAPGERVVVTGTIEDRFAQRTVRAAGAIAVLPARHVATPADAATGSLGEGMEGRLARISGTVRGAPSTLSSGLAFEVDDGSGAARVLVGAASDINTAAWVPGASLEVVGVVGQRDSSGTGASGYRLMPRAPADVGRVAPPAPPSPSPSPSSSVASSPAPDATPQAAELTSIASARRAPSGTPLTVRGVVTMPAGVVDATTAVIEDETAGIVVRVDESAPPLRVGDAVEVAGVRSTRSGMETIRATSAPTVLGTAPGPTPARVGASAARENLEARLVVIGGTLEASARRASSGTVSFDLADEGGTIRVVIPAALGADDTDLIAGAKVEVVGVVGQETTGAEPSAGYRLWPRVAAEVRIVSSGTSGDDVPGAATVGTSAAKRRASTAAGGEEAAPTQSLEAVDAVGLSGLRIGATLVAGDWPELGLAGLLWDGERLVAISAESRGALGPLGDRRPPIAVAVRGLRVVGTERTSGVPLVALGLEPGDVERGPSPPAGPISELPDPGDLARWVSVVGRLVREGPGYTLRIGGSVLALRIACDDVALPSGTVSVTGIGVAPDEVIVPCGGVRAAATLGWAAAAVSDGTPSHDPGGAPTVARDGPVEQPRTLPAALLLLGAAIASGSAAYTARQTARAPGGRGEAAQPALDSSEVPRLTLVRLERDGS